MQRIITWMKAHKGLTALAAFILLWISVSASPLFESASTRTATTGSSAGIGVADMFYAGDDGMDAAVMEESAQLKAVSGNAIAPSPRPPFEPSAGETAAEAEARIIKTGNITGIFGDVDGSVADLTGHASDVGGFIQHSSVSENRNGVRSGRVTMRVPVAEFESSLAYVRSLAEFVRHESTDGQDVTEQYTDLEARLSNARAQEEAYLEILERATDVEDILAVQRELGNIRAQIESYEGQLKYLENRTSLSTINVTLETDPEVQVPTDRFRPAAAVKQAVSALVNAFQGIVISLIWTAILGVGLLLPALLVIWILYRIVRKFWWKK